MAKATTHIERETPHPEVEQAQALAQLLGAVAANREALLVFLDIVQELHKLGLLEAVQALLKNSRQITHIGLQQLNKPGAQHILKNGMIAMQFLSKMEPSKLETLLNSAAAGMENASSGLEDGKQLGMWGLAKSIRNPEVNTSLNFMVHFLQGMGEQLHHSTITQ